MNLKPINNTILFQFVDPVNTKGEFEGGVSAGGIQLQSGHQDSATRPRWVRVTGAGPDVKIVKEGQLALLPALRWTPVIKFNGDKFWKTDATEIVAIVDDNGALVACNTFVLFAQLKNQAMRQVGLLQVVGGINDTPRGKVTAIGDKVDTAELATSTIYYSDVNFFDTFKVGDADVSFIKEDAIIAYEPA